ncbi:iron complex outermembrane recepter protein [Sphingomonas guangdongensis]|uniref:Iron complex outermembrane recepter protein n=1 Tax=Sphingomonas guangdongensis TaxID=1141890 RepID=A0A285QX31_9SPHN|nr:TonB-dependent receptor [Sphingomonas guangdongensis]SOB86386.1 iron complex outermembrane recepter protein [Sphingomonas guangdongensis]
MTKGQLAICASSGALILAMMAATPAAAQTQTTDSPAGPVVQNEPPSETEAATEALPAQEAGEEDDGEIVVTGTNISGVKPVGSEAISLNRQAILATGQTNAADVVRTLPQVRNLGEFREGGTQGGNNNQQGNAINLRGLGQAATLVLVDGHRITNTGASQTFTEANIVPLAALERVEVIADGASAIYGSDAVAGVVNFVVRKDYNGVEAGFRVSNSNGGFEYTPSLTAGATWTAGSLGDGSIIASYEFTHRDAYRRAKNPYLRQDLRRFGFYDARLNGTTATAGFNGNIVVPAADPDGAGPLQPPTNATIPLAGPNIYYGLPTGTNVGLSVGALRLNQPDLIDSALFNDYTGESERHQATLYLRQNLGDAIEVFVSGTYNNRETISATAQGVISNVLLRPTLYNPVTNLPTATPNPNYIPGLAAGPLTVQLNVIDSVGLNNWTGENEAYNITGGATVKLPWSWRADAYYTYGRDKACNYCQLGTNINPTALQYLIDIGEINPLNNVTPLSPATIARFTGDNIQRSGSGIDDVVVKLDGPLFALPGGTVRAAFGGERNKVTNYNINGANRLFNNAFRLDTDQNTSRGARTIWSAFAELYLPLVADDMDVPLIRSLTLSGAARYDDYSDVGDTFNPKISGTWEVFDSLTLRGSWGTSFRAPNLPDVNPSAISSGGTFAYFYTGNDPRIPRGPITAGYITGANPNLVPESADTWQVGADFEPIRNLKLSATYYNIQYQDRIAGPDVFGAFLNPLTYPNYLGYADFIFPIDNPAGCTPGNPATYDPVLADYLNRTLLYGNGYPDPCAVEVLLDGRNTNLAATKQDGLDLQVSYVQPFTGGAVLFNVATNTTLSNDQQVNPSGAFIDRLGFYSSPIKWRGRGSLGVNYHGFNALLFANYTGSYTNDQAVNALAQSIPPVKVGSYTTFDLNLGYSSDLAGRDRSFARQVRISVNLQNVTDKAPRLAFTTGSVFNPAYSTPFGRTVTMQLSVGF